MFAPNIVTGITFYWFEAGQKLVRSRSNYLVVRDQTTFAGRTTQILRIFFFFFFFFFSFFFCAWPNYEGWSKSSFLFLIQRKVRILSKFCDVYIEIKYSSSNWMLFEKQLWRHSLWHVTSRDMPRGVIVVNSFSRVTSAKFEIFFRSKKRSIPLRNAHQNLIATDPNTI